MTILWTNQARMDQVEIYETIAEDNPNAAERVYRQIEERVALLEKAPRLGVRRQEYAPELRMLVRGVYVILYRTIPESDTGHVEAVEIVRIIHGNRDIGEIFG
ncbi:MAG: type II toxin-antitoxin system RelE/ParE family toxin [Bryocella sp.]